MRALIVYWSGTGNTEQVVKAIHRGLEKVEIIPIIRRVENAKSENLYDYDLIFFGSPIINWWLPAQQVIDFIKEKKREYGPSLLGAPKLPGKNVVVFCTYSGIHSGIKEAIPGVKWMAQFFEHLRFNVKAEWYVVGEFHGNERASTKGIHGDIRGRPNAQDLTTIETDTVEITRHLNCKVHI